uniref:Uncharacterized protein n=1 Tax=Cannabis sativa TaxID=3483 RepID=A0A803P947_CANSA
MDVDYSRVRSLIQNMVAQLQAEIKFYKSAVHQKVTYDNEFTSDSCICKKAKNYRQMRKEYGILIVSNIKSEIKLWEKELHYLTLKEQEMNVLLHGPSDEVFKKWLNSMMKVVEYPLQKDGDDVKVDGEDKEKTVGNQKLKEEAELNSKEDVEFPVQQDSDDVKLEGDDKEKAVGTKKLKQKVNLHSKEDDNERSIAKTDGNASKKAQTKWPVKRIRIRESN